MNKEKNFIIWLSGVLDGANATKSGLSDSLVKKIEHRLKEFDFDQTEADITHDAEVYEKQSDKQMLNG